MTLFPPDGDDDRQTTASGRRQKAGARLHADIASAREKAKNKAGCQADGPQEGCAGPESPGPEAFPALAMAGFIDVQCRFLPEAPKRFVLLNLILDSEFIYI